MKTSITLVATVLAIVTVLVAASATDRPRAEPVHAGSSLPGDANCDGVVNSIDAAFVLQFSAGLLSALPCSDNADANGDGGVNSLDAALVLQYAAGLITSLGGPPPPPSPGGPPPTTTPDHFAECLSSAAAGESVAWALVGTPEFIAAIAEFDARCNDWITTIGYRPDLYSGLGYYWVQSDCAGPSHLLPHPGCALYYQMWGSWS